MLHVALLAVVMTALGPDDAADPSAADRKVYEAVRLKAGKDPAALVKLALWCEAHGLSAERGKHLMEAIGIDPASAAARGLLGLISYQGKWLSPDEVRNKRQSDENLAKKVEAYHARRAALESSLRNGKNDTAGRHKAALAHEKLGAWCEQQGLKDEATAHFTMAVQYDPARDAAWKHLGYIKRQGRWMTRDKIAALEQEATAQRKADRYWETLVRKWKADLRETKRREDAEASLAKVTDPRAVPSVVRSFAGGPPDDQLRATAILKGIEAPEATKELARLAVLSEPDKVRKSAIEALKKREPRDYVGFLIAMIPLPVEYKVQPVRGPGSQGALLIDTPRFTMLRTYEAPVAFTLAASFRGALTVDETDGMPIVYRGVDLDAMKLLNPQNQMLKMREVKARTAQLLADASVQAEAVQQQLIADVGAIEQFNSQAAVINERVLPVLQQAADAPASKTDQDGLYGWWYDRLGYNYQAPEKVQAAVNVFPETTPPSLTTCFAAGTPVRTMEGFRPIEEIRPGDLVLSQDVTTGGLDFRPIVFVHHNAPNQTLRITLSNDEILSASVYHRFWRSGAGWAQARDLKPGDVLRTLGSTLRVLAVEPGPVEPLFNLDVAQNRTFFAGNGNVLVHDNTLPPARHALFDETPNIELANKTPE
jgi:tetratricopeptide (TPR) repeat protein